MKVSSTPEPLLELDHIKRMMGSAWFLFDRGDSESSCVVALHAMNRLDQWLSALKNQSEPARAYLELLERTTFASLAQDRERLSNLNRANSRSIHNSQKLELEKTIERCSSTVDTLRQEVRRWIVPGYNWFWPLKQTCRRYFRPAFAVVGTLTLIYVVVALIRLNQVSKHAIIGTYYKGQNFEQRMKIRRDRKIEFRWGYWTPFLGFPTDHFSVRWTGHLMIEQQGRYHFETRADDGVRLWVAGRLLINDWKSHPLERREAEIELKPGAHQVTLEYYEEIAQAEVTLAWKTPSSDFFSVIPPDRFIAP